MARVKFKSLLKPIPLLLIFGALCVVVAILEITNTTHIFHKQNPNIVPSKKVTAETTKKSNQSTSADKQPVNTSTDQTSQKQGEANTSGTLITPSGTFVSNHAPGKNDTPTAESSVCNTSAGATCYIQFTKDGVTKSLDTQTADAGGSVYWSWDIRSSGLTAGSWKVTAVALLNGQTKTADDINPLVVAP